MSLRRLGLCLALLLTLSPALAAAQQPAATITTIAGGGPADGSPALSAALFWPMRVAMVPGSSDFYVSVVESHRVHRVSAATGAITTVAGAGGPGYNGDNIPANTAQISYPYGIAVDQATGDLYIADGGNNRIPSNMTVGAYYLIACADDAGNVTEIDETNNCLASDTTVQVTAQ